MPIIRHRHADDGAFRQRSRSKAIARWLEGISLFTRHGPPDHIRSDNGSEFTANAVHEWLPRVGVQTLYIEPGSP